jgi:outer membrane protein assembly factor BamB
VGAGNTAALELRGPALFATTTNRLLVSLSQETGRRYWQHRFEGPVSTGAAIAGNRIFVATEQSNGQAFAIDARHGRTVWSRRIGSTRLAPLLLDDRVYFASDQGAVFALSQDDGRVIWQVRLSGSVVTPPQHTAAGILVSTSADSVYLLDPVTGASARRARLSATASAAASVANELILFPLHSGAVVGLDAATLEPRFQVTAERLAEFAGAARASLAEVSGRLIAGLLDGRLIAVDVDGKTLWTLQATRSVVAPVAASRDALFVPLINGDVWKVQ